MKPRIYRVSPGDWRIRVRHLPYSVGPFASWRCAWAFADVPRGGR